MIPIVGTLLARGAEQLLYMGVLSVCHLGCKALTANDASTVVVHQTGEDGQFARFRYPYIGALAHGKWASSPMAERGLCGILIN
jgi:hypothetical protein